MVKMGYVNAVTETINNKLWSSLRLKRSSFNNQAQPIWI